MEARSFEISQFSVSVNMSTFMAERMLAYSWLSSRPSQVMQLPWGRAGAGGYQGAPERQCLSQKALVAQPSQSGAPGTVSTRTPPGS